MIMEMTQDSDADERTKEWLKHPLVRRAAEKAGGTEDPLLLVEKLLEIMTELEDKFPGVPFGKILAPATPASKNRVYAHLVNEAGLTEDEATAASSGFRGDAGEEIHTGRRLNRAELFAKVHAGAPLEAFERADRRHVQVLRRQPTEADIEVGRLIASGATQDECGRSKNTYHAAKLRLEYAEWQKVTRA